MKQWTDLCRKWVNEVSKVHEILLKPRLHTELAIWVNHIRQTKIPIWFEDREMHAKDHKLKRVGSIATTNMRLIKWKESKVQQNV